MPRPLLIKVGDVFGRLTVTAVDRRPHSIKKDLIETWVICRCECGNTKEARSGNVKAGHIQSCGCLMIDNMREVATTHGKSRTPLHYVWIRMNDRCRPVPTGERTWYPNVKVCDAWKDFSNFEAYILKHLGPPSNGKTIDRIDNDGDYEPGNVRWATSKEQARNRRTARLLTINGQTKCLSEWAEQYGMSDSTIINRLARGWSEKDAVTVVPVTRRPKKR